MTIPPGERRTLRFDFRPQQHGALEGQLRFVSSDPEHPRVAIPFAGLGLSSLLAPPIEQVFAGVALGERTTATIVLHNFAPAPVQILETEIRNAQFEVIGTPRRLAAGGRGIWRIEYKPTALGATRGALLFAPI